MWKPTQVGIQPSPVSDQAPAAEAGTPPPQAYAAPAQNSMSTYVEAVDRFSKAAAAFLQHVDLLTEARNAYQQAMTVSAELRNVLNAGDETLRNFMTQLEQAIHDHLGKPVLERKRPEGTKVESIKSGENGGITKVAT